MSWASSPLTQFLRELKRRRVFRVAVAYLVVAWLLVQVSNTTFPHLGLPVWSITLVIVLALVGFPLAVVLAWAFEMTPGRVTRDGPTDPKAANGLAGDAEGEEKSAEGTSWNYVRRRALTYLGGGVLVALVGLAAAALYLPGSRGPSQDDAVAISPPREASIAVLPFVNLSGDPATDPFVSGLHHDLLGQLSKIGGLTRVIPRTSVMAYAGTAKRVPEIAAELGVATVLEAGVQRVGNRVRIHALLVEGSTERHLWAESYEREVSVEELFDIQADIARRIARELAAELTPGEERRIRELPTENLEAYDLYLRAVVHGERWTEPDEQLTAISLLERAVELDPEFVQAWAKLSHWRNFLAWARNMPEQALGAREALDQAVTLDPDGVETLNALGEYHYRLRDYEQALLYFDQVDRLQPNRTLGVRAMITRRLGRWEEAAALMERQIDFDPRAYELHYALGTYYLRMRRFDDARRAVDRAISITPARDAAHRTRIEIALAAGDTVEARAGVDGLPGGIAASTLGRMRGMLDYHTRDFDGAVAVWPREAATDYLSAAIAALRGGQVERARALADSARVRAEEMLREAEGVEGPLSVNPRARAHETLAMAQALLGDEFAAREHATAAERLVPVAADHLMGVAIQQSVAEMLVLLSDYDAAVERLAYLLSIPSDVTVGRLRLDPLYDPLRGHPAFRRLLERG
jgi:TolB-like protein/Tfp pilus assembly protein PilF